MYPQDSHSASTGMCSMMSSDPSRMVPRVTISYAKLICSSPRLVRAPIMTVTELTFSSLYFDSSSMTASTILVTTETSCMPL